MELLVWIAMMCKVEEPFYAIGAQADVLCEYNNFSAIANIKTDSILWFEYNNCKAAEYKILDSNCSNYKQLISFTSLNDNPKIQSDDFNYEGRQDSNGNFAITIKKLNQDATIFRMALHIEDTVMNRYISPDIEFKEGVRQTDSSMNIYGEGFLLPGYRNKTTDVKKCKHMQLPDKVYTSDDYIIFKCKVVGFPTPIITWPGLESSEAEKVETACLKLNEKSISCTSELRIRIVGIEKKSARYSCEFSYEFKMRANYLGPRQCIVVATNYKYFSWLDAEKYTPETISKLTYAVPGAIFLIVMLFMGMCLIKYLKKKKALKKLNDNVKKMSEIKESSNKDSAKSKESESKLKESESKSKESESKSKESESKSKESELKSKESELKSKEGDQLTKKSESKSDIKESSTNKSESKSDIKESSTNKSESKSDIKESSNNKSESKSDIKESSTNKSESKSDIKESSSKNNTSKQNINVSNNIRNLLTRPSEYLLKKKDKKFADYGSIY